MSAFKINPIKEISNFSFDEKFLGFEYCLMILRQDLFIERLKKALEKFDFKTCMKLVEYSDLHKYTGTRVDFVNESLAGSKTKNAICRLFR